jgi:DNA replication and repair protein RecF
MYLSKLNLVNFKNYDQLDIELSEKINCFVGDNGTGKTNLLDAVYYLSLTKSYFNTIDTQNIMNGQDFFMIQGEYERDGIKENIYCGVGKDRRKQFKRNNKEYQKMSLHVGLIPVVMISPADTSLILEGSDERRKFINGVISQYSIEYLDMIIRYNRALVQRNVLLKDFSRSGSFNREHLDVWDEQLVNSGRFIYEKRIEFAEKFQPIFQSYYNTISEKQEKVSLIYQSQLNDGDFRTLLQKSIEKDRILQYTTVGIHKDDLIMNMGPYPIRRNGSQGQQKTYLVALKFAEFDFIKELNGIAPVLLLDDIFDKFDSRRVRQLISLVSDKHFGQIFITDTSQERAVGILEEISAEHKVFSVKNGKIEVLNGKN